MINGYIVNNDSESKHCQKMLFDKGYTWENGQKPKIFPDNSNDKIAGTK